MSTSSTPTNVEITAALSADFAEILTSEALDFVSRLHREFEPRRQELLKRRTEIQTAIDGGTMPDFLPETAHIREGDWQVAPIPADLQNRRVEITGPVERKMMINALNAGANVFMADFEDANSPTWMNIVQGQLNLRDAVNRIITFTNPNGKHYQLNEEIATLLVRPRGWHLDEKHMLVDSQPISASLFDFGLYFFHNHSNLIDQGSGPYFYLAKLENHLEAQLWDDVFVLAQETLGIPHGTIKATMLIENILAAFEMDEILYVLRDHAAGLNAGRWDYIFSVIKKFRNQPAFILPDRAQVTMTVPCMRAYTELLVQTCHKRGAHAIGGMAAFIPNRRDSEVTATALANVRADKARESRDGSDGTWVAHPDLILVAREPFDDVIGDRPHQKERMREDVQVKAADLINFNIPDSTITEAGLRININVAIQYMAAWLQGVGAAGIFNLMEDAATAEISRAQVWQWIHHPHGKLSDGRKITTEMVRSFIPEEMEKISKLVGPPRFEAGPYALASQLFDQLVTADEFADFLTLIAYEHFD